ncbi:MAG: nucleotidyltransferase domain-containing protein [Bacteroidia bacterium]|nr:nucleotidyltransferase domain-containing protein [Bacteroidia bacterium]
MTKKEQDIAQTIAARIKSRDPDAEVILFGSRARGQAHEESDWDILILMNRAKKSRSDENLYRDEIFQLELELGESISTLIYSKKEWENILIHTPIHQNIKNEGITLAS